MYEKIEDLKDYIGCEIEFEGFYKKEIRVLFEFGGKFWLNWCGGVNAETVKIYKIY